MTMRSIGHIPVNLEILCTTMGSGNVIANELVDVSVTRLYSCMMSYLIRRALQPGREQQLSAYARETFANWELADDACILKIAAQLGWLHSLGHLALQGLIDKQVSIPAAAMTQQMCAYKPKSQVETAFLKDIICLGFIRGLVRSHDDRSYEGQGEFLHLTLHEYFAAWFIAQHWQQSSDEILSQIVLPDKTVSVTARQLLRTYKYSPRFTLVWPFVIGLLGQNNFVLIESFAAEFEALPIDLLSIRHHPLILRCLEELPDISQIPTAWQGFVKNLQALVWELNYYFTDIKPQPTVLAVLRNSPRWSRCYLVPFLLEGLLTETLDNEETPKQLSRYDALVILQQLGSAAVTPAILSALAQALHDNVKKVRKCAEGIIVGLLGPAAATAEILSALAERLRDSSRNVRWRTQDVLGRLGRAAATAEFLTSLAQSLRDSNKNVRRSAANVIGRLGSSAATSEILAGLAQGLRDSSTKVRWSTASAVGDLGPSAATAEILLGLAQCLRDSRWEVRQYAAVAVGELGPIAATTEIMLALAQCLDDDDWKVFSHAARAVDQLGTAAAAIDTAEIWTRFNNLGLYRIADSRIYATDAVYESGPAAVTADILSKLAQYLRDNNKNVRKRAANVVGRLGSSAATADILSGLAQCLRDSSHGIRRSAAYAVVQLGSAAATADILSGLALCLVSDSNEYDRNSVVNAVGQLGSAAATTEFLKMLLEIFNVQADASTNIAVSVMDVLCKFDIESLAHYPPAQDAMLKNPSYFKKLSERTETLILSSSKSMQEFNYRLIPLDSRGEEKSQIEPATKEVLQDILIAVNQFRSKCGLFIHCGEKLHTVSSKLSNSLLSAKTSSNQQSSMVRPGVITMLKKSILDKIAQEELAANDSKPLASDEAKQSQAIFQYLAKQGYTWTRLLDEHLYKPTTDRERSEGEAVVDYLITLRDKLDYAYYEEAVAALFKNAANYTYTAKGKKQALREDLQGYQQEYYVFKITDKALKVVIVEIDIKAPGSRDLTSDIDTTVAVHLKAGWDNTKHLSELNWPEALVQAELTADAHYRIESLLQALIVYHFNRLNVERLGLTASLSRDSNVYSKDDSERIDYLKLYSGTNKTHWLINEEMLSLLTEDEKKEINSISTTQAEERFAAYKRRKEMQELAASFYSLREYYSEDKNGWEGFVTGFKLYRLPPPNATRMNEIITPAMKRTAAWYEQHQTWVKRLLKGEETETPYFFEKEDEVNKDKYNQAIPLPGFTLTPIEFRKIYPDHTLSISELERKEDKRIYANHYLYALSLVFTAKIEHQLEILLGDIKTEGSLRHAKAALEQAYAQAKAAKEEWESAKEILNKKIKKKEKITQERLPTAAVKIKVLETKINLWQQQNNTTHKEATETHKKYVTAVKNYDKLLSCYTQTLNQLQLARIKSNRHANEAYINYSALYHTVHWQQGGGDLPITRRHVTLCSVLQQIGFRLLHAKQYQQSAQAMTGYAKALKWGEILYRVAKYEERIADSFYGQATWFKDETIDIDHLDSITILHRLKPRQPIIAHTFPSPAKAQTFFTLLNRGVELVKQIKRNNNIRPQDKPKAALRLALNQYFADNHIDESYTDDVSMRIDFNIQDKEYWTQGHGKHLQDFLNELEIIDDMLFKEAIYQLILLCFKEKLAVKSQQQSPPTKSDQVMLWGHFFKPDPMINTIDASPSETMTP